MKRIGLCVLLVALCSPALPAQERPIWQWEESPAISLGVRDKRPTRGEFVAVFVVTSPKGRQFRAEAQTDADGWADVIFPRDFGTGATDEAGRFTYVVTVGGRVVRRGRFRLE